MLILELIISFQIKNCWSSEPYLITVGNNCAITKGVRIFTHGGARVARNKYPDFDVLGKVIIGDWYTLELIV